MAASRKTATRKKVVKSQPERYKFLKASGQTIGGYNTNNVFIIGEKMSKPEKRKLFSILAAQLDYDLK